MGFGTGHHATTRLCLELLQRVQVAGRRVIDVGTGSGVLALAAWALGASSVLAVDNDPDALQNARENIERNGTAGAIAVAELDLSDLPQSSKVIEAGDVVLANLTPAVLTRSSSSLRALVRPGGTLIASGFGSGDLDEIARALEASPQLVLSEDEWVAVELTF
jgi:ribosomal protein L11 methyltransferase